MNNFAPLKITYTLKAPICFSGYGVHLDSLLSFIAVHVAGYYNPSHPIGWEPEDNDIPSLPLARYNYTDKYGRRHWWYRSSCFTPEGVTQKQYWSKKFDVKHTEYLNLGKARKVTTAGGPWKEYFSPIESIFVKEVVFYAVGNYRAVKKLARRVRNIGKRGTSGFGTVKEFRIDKIDIPIEKFDLDWKNNDGTPARNLPYEFAREKELDIISTKMAPTKPPYWRIRECNVTEVAI